MRHAFEHLRQEQMEFRSNVHFLIDFLMSDIKPPPVLRHPYKYIAL